MKSIKHWKKCQFSIKLFSKSKVNLFSLWILTSQFKNNQITQHFSKHFTLWESTKTVLKCALRRNFISILLSSIVSLTQIKIETEWLRTSVSQQEWKLATLVSKTTKKTMRFILYFTTYKNLKRIPMSSQSMEMIMKMESYTMKTSSIVCASETMNWWLGNLKDLENKLSSILLRKPTASCSEMIFSKFSLKSYSTS